MSHSKDYDFDIPAPLQAPPSSGQNKLRKGLAWLTRQQRKYTSEDIVYVQASTGDRIACRGMLGNKLLKLDDGAGGFTIEQTELDVLIATEDLNLEPHRGDQVLLTLGTKVETFEVCPVGNEPPWRYSDPHESQKRIHCKHVQTDPYVPIIEG